MSRLRTLLILGSFFAALSVGTAFADLSAGIDADPEGNTATGLGDIDSCIEVSTGDTFEIDLFVMEVDDLIAWSADLQFDQAIVRVTDRDVEQILAAADGSIVFDSSDQTPSDDGRYTAAAVNTADSPQPSSGSGVLARITLEAVGPGLTTLSVAATDIDGNGTVERGLLLRNLDGSIIGDEDGDGNFDGTVSDASVAVDASCDDAPVTNDDASSDSWIWIVVAVAIAIAIGAAIVALLARRRASQSQ
jgi:hypothetical protein